VATAKISGTIQAEKKELIDLLLKKANLTADEIIDSAFTQWIRTNLDLLTEQELAQYKKFLVSRR
jgi:hypothetical protein